MSPWDRDAKDITPATRPPITSKNLANKFYEYDVTSSSTTGRMTPVLESAYSNNETILDLDKNVLYYIANTIKLTVATNR